MRRLQLPILLFLVVGLMPCLAQTVDHTFSDPSTGAITHFSGSLDLQDPAKVVEAGHLRNFGSMENESKAHDMASRCMKPLVIADLPEPSPAAAQPRVVRLMLFEFSLAAECTAGFKFQEKDAIAGGVAQAIGAIPGGAPIGPPLWLEWGADKLHLYTVGLRESVKPPALVSTATLLFKGHILGWMLTADSPATFNEFGNVEVELEPGRKYTLPFHVAGK
jgi:hypothetical protein